MKVIDTATTPDGTHIQLENWHENYSFISANSTLTAYPKALINLPSTCAYGQRFRAQFNFKSAEETSKAFSALASGQKFLADYITNLDCPHYAACIVGDKGIRISRKLRLLLFKECNRDCSGCCNKDWDLDGPPECSDFTPYDLIMLTGGEPMLRPDVIRKTVSEIRSQTNAQVILYTAMVDGLEEILPILDGVTVTLHNTDDIQPFLRFAAKVDFPDRYSLRLNVFDEVEPFEYPVHWKVKDHIHWIKDCPLPEDEVFMKLHH